MVGDQILGSEYLGQDWGNTQNLNSRTCNVTLEAEEVLVVTEPVYRTDVIVLELSDD